MNASHRFGSEWFYDATGKLGKAVSQAIAFLTFLAVIYLLFLAAGNFGSQVLGYLQDGTWKPLPATMMFEGWSWLMNPDSWFGVHRIVYGVLVGLSLPFAQAVLAWVVGVLGSMIAAVGDTVSQ